MEITRDRMKEFEEKFNSLEGKKQWEYILQLPEADRRCLLITLDNDSTDIMFVDDNDADFMMYFKNDIGNRSGVNDVLECMGFNVQDC